MEIDKDEGWILYTGIGIFCCYNLKCNRERKSRSGTGYRVH